MKQRAAKQQAKKDFEKRLEGQKAAADRDWSERYPFLEDDFYFAAGHSSIKWGTVWNNLGRSTKTRFYRGR
jgi:hypothetical protein